MNPIARRRNANLFALLSFAGLTALALGWCVAAFMMDAWAIVKLLSCGAMLLLGAITLTGVAKTAEEWDLPGDEVMLFAWQAEQIRQSHRLATAERDAAWLGRSASMRDSSPPPRPTASDPILDDLAEMRARFERLRSQ